MEYFISFMVGVLILMLITFLFKVSGKIIMKLLMNALVGGIMIFLINFFASPIGISIDLTLFSAIIVGMFGVFGIILLLIFGWIQYGW